MKTNPLKDGALTENSAGIGTVTHKLVREQTVKLALINGGSVPGVSGDEEDDEEHSTRERLAYAGVTGANHDQSRGAARIDHPPVP